MTTTPTARTPTWLASTCLLFSFAACAAGETDVPDGAGGGGGAGGASFTDVDPESEACREAAELKTSVACDYYAVMMDSLFAADDGCFVAFVANTSNQRAQLRVTFGDEPLDLGRFAKLPVGSGTSLEYADFDPGSGLAPGEVAILFLAGTYGSLEPGDLTTNAPVPCPVPAAVPVGAQIHGTGLGQAFHITTNTPVVAYQMLPYGGGNAAVTGATLLIPRTAWDTEYVAADAYGSELPTEFGVGPSMNIVAAEDDTHVSIVPNVLIGPGPGVDAANAGEKTDYTLAAGQVLQITQAKELTGSPIRADKPIGLFAGHQCANTPGNASYCDHAEQQIPAVRAFGHEHVFAGPRDRSSIHETPHIRIIGAVSGTTLSYEPAISGPSSIDAGQVVEIEAPHPFVVKSQDEAHPFLVLSYMTGATTVVDGYGDPDFVRVVPPEQYLDHYVFFTDPTYPETNLVVVRKRGEEGFADVELDCAGPLDGWTPIGDYEMTRIDLSRHDFQPQGGCDNGRREMRSDEPFGVWVWGWGTPETQGGQCNQSMPGYTCYVSYGYPAGEGLRALNDVELPVPY